MKGRGKSRSVPGAVAPDHLRTTARVLVVSCLFLFLIGLVMQVSACIAMDDPYVFARKQAVFGVVALMGAFVAAQLPYQYWRKLLVWLYPLTVLLLVMVLIVGPERNGAQRWLMFGPISVQPSEVGKLVVVLWMAVWFAHVQRRSHEFVKGFVVPVAGMSVICLLVVVQTDLGTTVLIGAVGAGMMFLAGTRMIYLFGLMLAGGAGLGFIVMNDKERLSRIISFTDPVKYEQEGGYQLLQSLFAFVMGGGHGVGFGQGDLKHSYLPEKHTDFILSIVAEEIGVAGPLMILLLFFVIMICGLRIGWNAHDAMGRFIAYGITLTLGLQAAINIGVVTGSLPTKGMPLPFVSYGGSSLVICSVMAGLLVSVAHHNSEEAFMERRKLVKDRRHWV